ncbi:TRAP transporter large permease [Chloroflexota bacterium]
MEHQTVILIVFVLMMVLLLGGEWIFVALGGSAVIGLILLGSIMKLTPAVVWAAADSWELSCVPLFIFMGEIIFQSGLSRSLYESISLWLGRLPGGLLHTNVVASALFASVSGSTVATTATIGTLAIPEQRRRGYSDNLILGSIAASGSIGVLIPPSINMILYAAWVQVSLGRLFMGGVIPGILISVLFMAYIGFAAWRKPELAPVDTKKTLLREKIVGLSGIVPILVIVFIIWGGIYTGWMTPTEAAAVAAFAALAIAAISRKLSWQSLNKSLLATVQITCMTMSIYIGAKLLVTVVGFTGITEVLLNKIADMNLGLLPTLFAVYGIYIVLGCFLDGIALMLVTIPFLIPILNFFSIDLIWFGVTLILLMQMSFITPPVGTNLYVVSAIANAEITAVVKGILPFFLLLFIGVLILTFFPSVVMFLPNTMTG